MRVVEAEIAPPTKELVGGFEVRRALPSLQRRTVGPFVFFDEMGPAILGPGRGLDVAPHPHIGLATVTYLFEGELLHRDSLGTVQPIRPGEVNWMTAGRGIVHSERTPPGLRQVETRLFGIQTWLALPREREEDEPAFAHFPAAALPVVEGEGLRLRVIAGSFAGATSPVRAASATLYVEARLDPAAVLALPTTYAELAIYVVEGTIELGGDSYGPNRLLVLAPRAAPMLRAEGAARVMVLGGDPIDGPRHLWWNFVSSSRERIEQAKADWGAGRFPRVPGEGEFIPLPGPGQPATVRYP